MKKESMTAKLHDAMLNRITRKVENGKQDFTAYPMLGKLAVGLLVGVGEKSDPFYNALNQDIVTSVNSQVYARRGNMGSGTTDSANRVRVIPNDLGPVKLGGYEQVVIRAASPRTQSR
jgi:hypothetical protein